MHLDKGVRNSTLLRTTASADATATKSLTPCADQGYIPNLAGIFVYKPTDQHKRGEKLAIDLRKSRKKELIKSKRKLQEEATQKDEELKKERDELGQGIPQPVLHMEDQAETREKSIAELHEKERIMLNANT
jgi:hypothetical protein